MELVAKIFETLGITQLALLQMALVVVLVFLLSSLLIRPVLATFEERENRSVKPVEEARRMTADAESKAAAYEEALRKAAAEALSGKRKRMEEAGREQRKEIESVIEETNRKIDAMRAQIGAEKEETAKVLRAEVSRLSVEIAVKVLGRPVA